MTESLLNRSHFAYETQIRNLNQWKTMCYFQNSGFYVHLAYVGLEDHEVSAVRVRNRMEKGGHREVSPELAIECFHANLVMLNQYFSAPDELHLYDGTGASLVLLASLKKGLVTQAAAEEQQPGWIKDELGSIYEKIQLFHGVQQEEQKKEKRVNYRHK